MEALFSACGGAAVIGWLLLVFAPRWSATRVIAGAVIPLGIAVVYLGLAVRYLPGAPGGFGSLADVALLFTRPGVLLAGWVHYLAFDLFIGAWQVRDAAKHGVPHALVVPCLVLTFLLGPIGLLAYMALRSWKAGTPVPDTV